MTRASLEQAYRELLRKQGVALSSLDSPNQELLQSLAATLDKVTQHVGRRGEDGLTTTPDFADLLREHWTGPASKPATVDDNIVRHLALLPYPSWSHVGREPRTLLLNRIATMAQRPRAFKGINADRYQRVLDEKQEQIQGLIQRSGQAIEPAYVGLFPTGSHNAEAMRVDAGVLILINSGLMNLLFQLAKINVASSTYKGERPLLDKIQTSIALGELLAAHTVGGSSFLARGLPLLDRGRLEIASKLTTYAEAFVIAHEYGHAVAGHLTRRHPQVEVQTDAGRLALYQQSQEEEYEADRAAIDIMGPALRMPDSPRGEAVALSAALLFFFIDLVVRRFRDLLGLANPTPTTHPSTADRYERARQQLMRYASSRIAFDHADALTMWFNAHEAHIAQFMADAMKTRQALDD